MGSGGEAQVGAGAKVMAAFRSCSSYILSDFDALKQNKATTCFLICDEDCHTALPDDLYLTLRRGCKITRAHVSESHGEAMMGNKERREQSHNTLYSVTLCERSVADHFLWTSL